MSRRSQIQTTYTKSGLKRFVIEIWHDDLNKFQAIKGDSPRVVEQKAIATMAQWDDMWADRKKREQKAQNIENKKQLAKERTEEAQGDLATLERILEDGIKAASRLPEYRVPKPKSPKLPQKPTAPTIPPEPDPTAFKPKVGFIDQLLDAVSSSRVTDRNERAKAQYLSAHAEWKKKREDLLDNYKSLGEKYNVEVTGLKAGYDTEVKEWEEAKAAYSAADGDACLAYFSHILSASEYPDYFPQDIDLAYNSESRILIVDYQLPSIADLPKVKEVRYIQSRNEFTESTITDAQLNRLYDSVLYQIVLRTIHELFDADSANTIGSLVFNGYVDSIDPATGQEVHACVLSLMTNRDDFADINLLNVDPKACFKKLKGVGSSQLHSMTPIAPILEMEREDRRFVDSHAVAAGLEGENLAAMDWEEFEHLVRELFESEFSGPGSEVKVTRASRDGGIDAVVFDPDPLRGGKIVIQAKRYTNTVGVSAVRDLYGTLINEGANQGILVSTSDYGPDAYEFAKDKPIKLLSGSNLLHLLEKHGHKAYIDLKEAKKILKEQQ